MTDDRMTVWTTSHGTQTNAPRILDPSSTARLILYLSATPRPCVLDARAFPPRRQPQPASSTSYRPPSRRAPHPNRFLPHRHTTIPPYRHYAAPLPQPEHSPLHISRYVAPGSRGRLRLERQHCLAPPARLPRARSQEPRHHNQHKLSLRLEDGGAPLSLPTPLP